MDADSFVNVDTTWREGVLSIRVKALKKITLVELQGNVADLEAFGATMPDNFRKMRFGEGVEIPDGMKDDIEFMNKMQFRWGFNIPVAAGQEVVVNIPAPNQGKERAIFTLAYNFPKFMGLLTGKSAIYLKYGAAA